MCTNFQICLLIICHVLIECSQVVWNVREKRRGSRDLSKTCQLIQLRYQQPWSALSEV